MQDGLGSGFPVAWGFETEELTAMPTQVGFASPSK